MSFTIYCAVLPSGWSVLSVSDDYGSQTLQGAFKSSSGPTLDLWEGKVCPGGGGACSPTGTIVMGSYQFGDRTTIMTTFGTNSWEVKVNAGSDVYYVLKGSGMDKSTFASLSAAMHRLT